MLERKDNTDTSDEDPGQKLLEEAWKCIRCVDLREIFEADAGSDRWFRFPPIIGCQGRPLMLFVGINPRVSYSGSSQNDQLHRRILAKFSEFAALASNCDGREAYIAEWGGEPYYRPSPGLPPWFFEAHPVKGNRLRRLRPRLSYFSAERL